MHNEFFKSTCRCSILVHLWAERLSPCFSQDSALPLVVVIKQYRAGEKHTAIGQTLKPGCEFHHEQVLWLQASFWTSLRLCFPSGRWRTCAASLLWHLKGDKDLYRIQRKLCWIEGYLCKGTSKFSFLFFCRKKENYKIHWICSKKGVEIHV